MKNHLIFICACCLFAAACSKATTAANTNAPANTTANTIATKTDEPVTSILKSGDSSPDKAIKVIELVDSAAADKTGWKGKEVDVTGYVSATSTSGKNQTLTILNDQTATIKKDISCTFQGDKPDGLFAKNVEVKGKISFVNTDGEYKSVNLEPCEVKK